MHAPLTHTLALTFLDPFAGLLAAGLSVPALLLLYFLKLRRRPVRVTASFLWQRAAEDLQVNTPFRWLRVSIVLLLQLLALLLLCAAIARPALSDLPPAGGRVILLIDASASMSARDASGGASRLDDAKRRALEFLDSLDLGSTRGADRTEAMVLVAAAETRVVASFSSDRAALRAAIRSVEPTDQPADLRAALEIIDAFAAQTTADESDEASAPTLVIFSDGGLAPAQHDGSARTRFTAAVREVRFVSAGPDAQRDPQNLGVVAISAQRDERAPTLVRVFGRVANASRQPAQASVTLEIDGRASRSVSITVPGSDGFRAGEAPVTFEADAPGLALLTLRVTPGGDLASDDSASLVIDPPGGVTIALVAPVGAVPGRASPDSFLREALEALEPRLLRVMTPTQHDELVDRNDRSAGSPLTADLVVYDRVTTGALPLTPSVSFGAPPRIEGLVLEPFGGPARATRFVSWQRTNPLMRAVALGDTLVARPLQLTLPGVGESGVSRVEPIAFGERSPLIVFLEHRGVGRVVVAFELAQSTWPLDIGFLVFLANTVEALAPRASAAGRAFTTAQPLVVRPAPGAARIEATGPATLEARAPADGSASRVSLGIPTRAGLYSLAGALPEDAVAPVNLADARESAIRAAERLPITTRDSDAVRAGEAAPREIWHLFALASVLFLAMEWLLFAWRMRV